jgi:hypothetical protein
MTLEAFIATFGYLGVFILMFVINVVPAFMPPTWLFLSTLYFLFPQYLNPVLLAFTGAFASSFGRFVLSHMGSASRRVMSDKRRRSMDLVGQALKSKKHAGFILSFLFALSPLPSNFYFLMLGEIGCQYFSIFLGFWLGRLISYWVMINITHIAFQSLTAIVISRIQAVIIINSLGIISMVIFVLIDWEKLILERRLAFIKPRFLSKS